MRLFRFVFALLLFSLPLLSTEEKPEPRVIEEFHEPDPIVDLQGVPSNIVGGCVNVISGHYFDSSEDLCTPGSNSIKISRFFSKGIGSRGELGYSWDLDIKGKVKTKWDCDNEKLYVSMEDRGMNLRFEGKSSSKLHLDKRVFKSGFVNVCSPYFSGQQHLQNKRLYKTDVHTFLLESSGLDVLRFGDISRTSHTYRLRSWRKADGCQIRYHYKNQKRGHVKRLVSLSSDGAEVGSVEVEREGKNLLRLKSCDGREVTYHLQRKADKMPRSASKPKLRRFLTSVETNFGPRIDYKYTKRKGSKKKYLTRKELPGGRYLDIRYGKHQRVSALFAPIGVDETPIQTQKFSYGRRRTFVWDALGMKKVYVRDKQNRLTAIKEYAANGQIYRIERLHWGNKNSVSKTLLKARTIEDGNGTIFLAKSYIYTDGGNIHKEITYGNLSGQNLTPLKFDKKRRKVSGGESYCKIYGYDNQNRVTSEWYDTQTIRYTYYKDSTRIKLKTISDRAKIPKVCQRYYYEYDGNASMTLEIVDDGSSANIEDLTDVTERRIQRIVTNAEGLPLEVRHFYLDLNTGTEVLLSSTRQEYTPTGLMTCEQGFDAQDQLVYTKQWTYNSWGKVTQEIDPLGNQTFYSYDSVGNCILKRTDQAEFLFTYDLSNRLIKEEIHAAGQRFSKTHRYDLKGNKVCSTDIYGNETHFTYDAFGRITHQLLPAIPDAKGNVRSYERTFHYNELNHLVQKQDGNGFITKTEFNAFGKPTRIEHPDGSVEECIYNTDGTVKEQIDRSGVRTRFSYDFLQRKIAEDKYSCDLELLSSHTWIYNAFHLIREIEPDGTVVDYSYDGAGRQIREVRGSKETLYRYDALGRVSEKWERIRGGIYRVSILEKDLLDRVIEERVEDEKGELFLRKQYAYDSQGNRTEETIWTSSGPSTTTTHYNALNLPTKIVAPDGAETYFVYDFDHLDPWGCTVPHVQKIDSLGNVTTTIKNAHDSVAFEETKNVFGQTVQEVRLFYDANQHLVKKVETLLIDEKVEKVVNTVFEYDEMGREIAILEAYGDPDQKVTRRSYHLSGVLASVYKPDGIVVSHDYDALGRLTRLISSDGSVAISYVYDLGNRIIEAHDGEKVTKRAYDEMGLLQEELLDHGARISYAYDNMGRLEKLVMPDDSEVAYRYNAGYLKEVERKGQIHQYEYDISGKLMRATSPITQIAYSYDACLRPVKMSSDLLKIESNYDALGNVTHSSEKVAKTAFAQKYSYDALQQVTEEKGFLSHTYRYDSLGNRIGKNGTSYTNNALNQLLQQGQTCYRYDQNGNLVEKASPESSTHYRYDALDRLIEVRSGEDVTRYHYDPFHRRTTKTTSQKEERYLYQGDKECGVQNADGKILELKIMGIGSGGDIGAALFLELGEQTYIPLHDYRGNIVLLCNLSAEIIESYRYTAFGEEKIYDASGTVSARSINPWRFSSKRVDPESGWSCFGHRYYDPEIGRWTTPDPLWFADGSNLYCYVHNRPTRFIDPDGLFAEGLLRSCIDIGLSIVNCYLNTGAAVVEVVVPHSVESKYKDNPYYGCTNVPYFLEPSFDHKSHGIYRKNVDLYGPVRIGFVNGMNNELLDVWDNMDYIHDMGFDCGLTGVDNATHGFVLDILKCGVNFKGGITRPVTLLHKQWDDYFANCDEGGIIIQLCHSQGAIQVRNALQHYDPELRKRIFVIAVAPGAYIDKALCGSVIHLVSDGDWVHMIDREGRERNRDTTVELPRHPEEKGRIDHAFRSLTFKDQIKKRVEDFMLRGAA